MTLSVSKAHVSLLSLCLVMSIFVFRNLASTWDYEDSLNINFMLIASLLQLKIEIFVGNFNVGQNIV